MDKRTQLYRARNLAVANDYPPGLTVAEITDLPEAALAPHLARLAAAKRRGWTD